MLYILKICLKGLRNDAQNTQKKESINWLQYNIIILTFKIHWPTKKYKKKTSACQAIFRANSVNVSFDQAIYVCPDWSIIQLCHGNLIV